MDEVAQVGGLFPDLGSHEAAAYTLIYFRRRKPGLKLVHGEADGQPRAWLRCGDKVYDFTLNEVVDAIWHRGRFKVSNPREYPVDQAAGFMVAHQDWGPWPC